MSDPCLYLTTLECPKGDTFTIAHEGEERAPTAEAPWPIGVKLCAICGAPLPGDLGVAIVEVREAAVLPPPTEREDMTEEELNSWAWQYIESHIPGRGRVPPREGGTSR